MTNHLMAVVVDFAKNRRGVAIIACALLLGIGWATPTRGAERNQVSTSPSTQRVAPRPDGLRAAKLLQSVAVGDFNGDGLMDFAVADFLSDSILVMLGDGEGHFRLAAKLPSGGGPRAIVAGDFNHDGLIDLAVANFFSGDVTIFLGRGDGSFEDPHLIPLAPGLSSLAGADLHSDGSLDLVAANFLTGALTVLKGGPDGSFAVEATLESVPAVSVVYVQDFNGDGHQDLIAVDASEKQAWLFVGNGHGAFQPGKSIDPQAASLRLATPSQATATTAALNPLPAIAKAAGDGQLAYPGSVLPGNLVVALTEPKGGVAGPKSMFFSSLYGGASVMSPSPAAAGDQGQMSAKVQSSALPGINFVATSASGGTAAVFGEASVLQLAAFFNQVESDLSPPAIRQLLDKAQSQLKSNDVVGAVLTLESCLELLAPTKSKPGAEQSAPGSEGIDLLDRLLNQVILFGPNASGTISCGQVVSGTIATGTQDDYYTFSANAGDIITFPIKSTGGYGFNPCAYLYVYPSGTTSIASVCNALGGPFTITATGTYIFVVHDQTFSNTGTYDLGLQFMQGQCPTGATGCGQIKNGSMGTAQQDVYTFSAKTGDIITFPSLSTGGYGYDPCTDLYNTSGKLITTEVCNGLGGPFTIPSTGSYIFVVHDYSYSTSGTYNLGLQFMQAQCPNGTTGCGQIKSGSMGNAQQDVYTFSAKAGDIITYPSLSTGGYGYDPCTDLYNTSGKQIGTEICNGLGGPFTIPSTGSYIFVVHDHSYSTSGTYNLGLQFMQAQCPNGTTGCGQIKSGSMGNAQQDVYTFSAKAGDIITYPSLSTGGYGYNPCTDLYNTSGTQIGTEICNGLGGPFTIPSTGSYIFVVHDHSYSTSGTYNLGLQFMQAQCPNGTTGCGQIKSGSMGNAQQDVYTFSAKAGDIITYPSLSTGGYGYNPCTDLYNTSGTQLGTEICNGLGGPFTIPSTGSYIFVVHDHSYSTSGTYNLGLQFMQAQCPNGATGCGQIKKGTMGNAQQDVYTFSAKAGDIITYPSLSTGGYGYNPCTDLYNTSGKLITTEVCNSLGGPFTIPSTGSYIFVVHDYSYSTSGTYDLGLQFMQGQCPNGATGCSQIVSGTLGNAQQSVYTFVATEGEVVNVSSVSTGGYGFNPCTDLYNTSGTKIGNSVCNTADVSFTIPATATYILVVHDASYSTSGSYNLSWSFTLGCPTVTGLPGSVFCGTDVLTTSSPYKTVTLSNTGIQPLTVLSITNQGANSGDFGYSTTCGQSLAAGTKCGIDVKFIPKGPGPRKTVLTIDDNAIGTMHRVLLTGVGTAVSLSPVSLSFAAQTVGTSSSSQQITVTNDGSATVNFFEIALGGKNPGDFLMSNACGSSLAPAGTCMVTVTFKPTATGARTASVLFSDNGGGNLQSVGLSGTGQ